MRVLLLVLRSGGRISWGERWEGLRASRWRCWDYLLLNLVCNLRTWNLEGCHSSFWRRSVVFVSSRLLFEIVLLRVSRTHPWLSLSILKHDEFGCTY